MDKINVLWMNNGDVKLHDYPEKGIAYHLSITTCQCMTDCRHKMDDLNTRWDAIILNAEVKILPNQIPNELDLIKVVDEVKVRNIPWFVVTSKDLKYEEILRRIVPDERIYNIKNEYDILFETIQIKVSNNPKIVAREKYGVVYKFCPDIENLLIKLEYEDIKDDVTILNECRKILEWIKNYTLFSDMDISYNIKKGFEKNGKQVVAKTYSELSLNDFSIAIGLGLSTDVPIFVKRCFYACVSTTNPGSHKTEVDATIRKGDAPYVTKTLIYELLNVLYWCASLNEKTFKL